jgi:NitT/TauT family transport system permease protein
VLFGIGETAKIALIFWGVMWAVLLYTISGVSNIDPQLVRASKSMGAGKLRLFATVVLPGALPYIFTGMRLSATTSILILIGAEMNGASKGIGYQVFQQQTLAKFPGMYAYVIVLTLIGLILSKTLSYVEKNSFRWREDVSAGR